MRRPVTAVVAALAVTLFLVAASRAVLLTASSQSASKADLQADLQAVEGSTYTASADYTVAVPAIGVGDGWQTVLHIQNAGQVPTSARIEFFGASNAECPAASEPMAVQCVGPIPAGAVQTFDLSADTTLAEVRSAIVRSARPDEGGCASTSGEPLAVLVRRTWVRGGEEPRSASSAYVGIAPAVAGFWDSSQQAYVTVVPWIESRDTSQTVLYLQNIGLQCAEGVELELISGPGSCVPMPRPLPIVPPGSSLRVNVANQLEDEFSGSAWIRSPQPLAVVVDRWSEDGSMLSTHATGRAAGQPAVDAPVILQTSGGENWSTRLRIHNVSARVTALVETAYRTSEITPTLKSESFICPGGSITSDTGAVPEFTSPFTGTAALLSLVPDPELPEVPPLAADVDLLHAGGGAAYHAPNRITDTVFAPGVALPWLTRSYHPMTPTVGLTYTSQIAVVNQSDVGSGFITLTFYDPDGSLTTYQPATPLGPGAMRLIELTEVPDLPAGWYGSAILEFLSLQPPGSVAVAVVETSPGTAGDATTSYAGIVTQVQAQPTPTPQPTATLTPTATATPKVLLTPTPAEPAPEGRTYLPLLGR